jgi:hypothetical protein
LEDQWVLLLDADILLPEELGELRASLDPACLYSARRRLCTTEAEWQAFRQGIRSLSSFPLDQPRALNPRVWNLDPATPVYTFAGYFHLWHHQRPNGTNRMPRSTNAAWYDVRFALSYPPERRVYLQSEVLHLGPIEQNWNGRSSSSWSLLQTSA